MNGHKITGDSNIFPLICVDGSTLTIKDGVGGGEIINNGCAIDCTSGATLNIESGTIKSSADYAVWITIGSNATISGGSISSGFKAIFIYGDDAEDKCTLKITGGEIICTENEDNNSAIGAARYADVEISGGTITGVLEVYQDLNYNVTGTYTITGGTFSNDPSDYLKSGYKVTESNGKYVVSAN